jgi:site-specific recombinase XerD
MDSLADWVDEWALRLKGDPTTEGTAKVYLRAANQFLAWLAAHDPDVTDPEQLTEKHCLGWMAHLGDLGRSDATRRVRAIGLRLWIDYMVREQDSGLDRNPAATLKLPVPKDKPVPVIPDEDFTTLLRSMSGTSYIDRRDTAIVRLLFDTGIRRGELVAIDTNDLDMRHQEALVHGKGGKDRIVPFMDRTALALRKFLRARQTRPACASPPLFLSTRLTEGGSWRMTGGGVADMIARRCEAAGLEHQYPHMYRHSWAADNKLNGMNDSHLERLAGWSTPTMSRRYGNAVADHQARVVARRLARGDRV